RCASTCSCWQALPSWRAWTWTRPNRRWSSSPEDRHPMPDELLDRLRRFHDDAFPQYRQQFRTLVDEGQHPTTLFVGCSDSRLVPYLLTGAGPGELFLVRNVGAFIPPYDGSHGHHGTTAAIEFAVLNLKVRRIDR